MKGLCCQPEKVNKNTGIIIYYERVEGVMKKTVPIFLSCSFYTPSYPIVDGKELLLAQILKYPERQVLLFLFTAMIEYNTTQIIFNRKLTNIYDATFIIDGKVIRQ